MINIKSIKKTIATVSITLLSISALLGLLLLFKIIEMNDVIGNVLLSFLTIFIGGLFSLTSLKVIEKKPLVGYLSISCIILSAILFLLQIWLAFIIKEELPKALLYAAVIISALSIYFNVVIDKVIYFMKDNLVIQVSAYLFLLLTEIWFCILIIGGELPFEKVEILIAIIIFALVFFLILKIKSKNVKEEMIYVNKNEYEALKLKVIELENELKKQSEMK